MSFYAVDVPIFGTVYIKASTAVKAQQSLNRLVSRAIEHEIGHGSLTSLWSTYRA